MKRFQLAAAFIACGLATSAMATPTPATYDFYAGSSNGYANTASSTGGANTSNGKSWNDGNSGAYGAGGTNYGNTYTWNSATTGSGPLVTVSAWGSTALSSGSAIQKAWIGDYGSSYGLGITSQSSGELNSAHDPDNSSPTYQHAIDSTSAYESLMFSFASAVTLNSVKIGFTGPTADATVLEYKGTGNPTSALTIETYSTMLCATTSSTNCWSIVGNLLNMQQNSTDAIAGGTASAYWMVGAYLPFGSNATTTYADNAFKVEGFSATRAVPEPSSIALFGIAGAALFAGRRRRNARAA